MTIYQLRRSQRLSVFVLVALTAFLGITVTRDANSSINNIEILSNSASTTSNMVIMQRESLVFAYEYERWMSGSATRRELQIRRSLLAQRLAVRDEGGVANGERAQGKYLSALQVLDAAIAASPSGLLPIENRSNIRLLNEKALVDFISETRDLVQQISQASDRGIREVIQDQNIHRRNQNAIVVLILLALGLTASWLGRTRIRDFKKIRQLVSEERIDSKNLKEALKSVEEDLEVRLFSDITERDMGTRLDGELLIGMSEIRKALTREEIVKIAIDGLSNSLHADSSVFISYKSTQLPSMSYQKTSETGDLGSIIDAVIANQLEIKPLLRQIWSHGGICVLNSDSPKSLSDHFSILGERFAKVHDNWIVIVLSDDSDLLGCIWVGVNDREQGWSKSEVGFAQRSALFALATLLHMHANDLKILAIDRKNTVDRLIEIDSEKNAFIANVNHELRTPLTSIVGYLELILDYQSELVDKKLIAPLDAIKRNAMRLQNLIENMLQVAKLDASAGSYPKTPVLLNQILEESIHLLKISMDDRNVRVELNIDSEFEDFGIRGDPERLLQVFINLISNAIKFSHPGGLVEVFGRRDLANSGNFQIDICDSGVGIPESEKHRIFGRFYRASTATQTHIPGTGLGLSIVKQIVHEHKGTVSFTSTEGKGSVFTVRFPQQSIGE